MTAVTGSAFSDDLDLVLSAVEALADHIPVDVPLREAAARLRSTPPLRQIGWVTDPIFDEEGAVEATADGTDALWMSPIADYSGDEKISHSHGPLSQPIPVYIPAPWASGAEVRSFSDDSAELEEIVGDIWSYDHGWGTRSPADRRRIIEAARAGASR